MSVGNIATEADLRRFVEDLLGQLPTKLEWLPGDVRPTCRSAAAKGWLECDGSAVSRTAYPRLFAEIGTDYGAGDGSTTFNLPDYRGRTLYGVGSHGDVNARGDSDGLAEGSRTPKHAHATPQHTHNTTNTVQHVAALDAVSGVGCWVTGAYTSDVGTSGGATGTDGPAYGTVDHWEIKA